MRGFGIARRGSGRGRGRGKYPLRVPQAAGGSPGFGKGFRQRRSDERAPRTGGAKRPRGRSDQHANGGRHGLSSKHERPNKRVRHADEEEEEDEESGSDHEGAAPGGAFDALMRSLRRGGSNQGADADQDTASDDDDAAAPDEDVVPEQEDDDGALPAAVDEDDDEQVGGAGAMLDGSGGVTGAVVAVTGGDAYIARVGRMLTVQQAALLGAADKRPVWTAAGEAMPGAVLAPVHGPQGVTSTTWEVCTPEDQGLVLPAASFGDLQTAAEATLPAGLAARWLTLLRDTHTTSDGAHTHVDWSSPAQASLYEHLHGYKDVLYTARAAPPVIGGASDPVLDACITHALGHCLRGRAEVLRHNERLRAKAKANSRDAAAAAVAAALIAGKTHATAEEEEPDSSEAPQDQGFTRPKLLVLCPTRAWAKQWLDRALQLLPCANTGAADCVSNRERWEAQYGPRQDEAGHNPRSVRHKAPGFASVFFGNRDDHFRLGVKLTARSVRLFVDFAGADIILASPLGLATRLEAGDATFLSSIELVILDGADVMLQQNWAHVEAVFAALNAMPTGGAAVMEGLDVMRVRPWYLDGHAKHYRQTVVLSAHGAPEFSALLRQHCANWAGVARTKCTYAGALSTLASKAVTGAAASHAFTRISAADVAAAADARFAHFTAVTWPRLSASAGGELLLVPSYFDFVRVRNFLRSQDASFVTYCEYTDPSDVGTARRDFGARDAKVLVHTQRAWFFRRHVIKGASRVTFYSPPDVADCYVALATALGGTPGGGEVETLFTRWDRPQLERIVGTARCAKLMAPGGSGQFLFC